MPKAKSKTDWERVKREDKGDAPIPYSPGDGPYNPNDPAAVNRYWDSAAVRSRGRRGPQKTPTKERITIRLSSRSWIIFAVRARAGNRGSIRALKTW